MHPLVLLYLAGALFVGMAMHSASSDIGSLIRPTLPERMPAMVLFLSMLLWPFILLYIAHEMGQRK